MNKVIAVLISGLMLILSGCAGHGYDQDYMANSAINTVIGGVAGAATGYALGDAFGDSDDAKNAAKVGGVVGAWGGYLGTPRQNRRRLTTHVYQERPGRVVVKPRFVPDYYSGTGNPGVDGAYHEGYGGSLRREQRRQERRAREYGRDAGRSDAWRY